MAKYTAIADTSERLVKLLQSYLVPEVLPNANEIGLRSPDERGDVSLGIFLYDIQESEEIHNRGSAANSGNRQSRGPVFLTLYYCITAYSAGDVKYRLQQEEKILGRVVQALHDCSVLPPANPEEERGSELHLQIQLLRLSIDEKSKIWNFINVSHKLSLFYKVTPVAIEAARSHSITRVTQVDIHTTDLNGEE